MRPLFLLLLACTALLSCNGPSYRPLTSTSIYSSDSVRLAMNGGDEKAAGKKFQEALDLYKKGKDSAGSIALFKSSILLKPTARAYYELAGALSGTGQYYEAIQALRIAERLGYSPLANVMFRYAYAYTGITGEMSNMPAGDSAVHYMELAIQMGFAHPQQFLRKEYFHGIFANESFDAVYAAAISGSGGKDPEKTLWETYMSQFPSITLPLVINRQWISDHLRLDQISFQMERFVPDMRDAKFSRDGGSTYYYIAMLRKDSAYTAVLYSTLDQESDEDTTSTPMFVLATYQAGGKLIDRMQVAGKHDLTAPFRLFSMQPNLHFQIQDFFDANTQNPDSTATARDSSNVAVTGAQPAVNYLIDASGKFIKTDAQLALR